MQLLLAVATFGSGAEANNQSECKTQRLCSNCSDPEDMDADLQVKRRK